MLGVLRKNIPGITLLELTSDACCAVVAGLNDPSFADMSCSGFGARLHVGTMGFAIP